MVGAFTFFAAAVTLTVDTVTLAFAGSGLGIDADGETTPQHAVGKGAAGRSVEGLMRQEVRPHSMGMLEQAAHTKVDCTSSAKDPVTSSFCALLTGSNAEVMKKIRHVSARLRRGHRAPGADIRLMTQEQKQAKHQALGSLQASLGTLFSCAERSDVPCEPLNTDEEEYAFARTRAQEALAVINDPNLLAANDIAANNIAGSVYNIAANDPVHTMYKNGRPDGTALLQMQDLPVEEPVAEPVAVPVAEGGTKTEEEFADATLEKLLKGTRDEAGTKLQSAIDKLAISKVKEDEVVGIVDDEKGTLKDFKACLLVLHGCATMPKCDGSDKDDKCCDPKFSEKEPYKSARSDCFAAWSQLSEDETMGAKLYKELVTDLASGDGPPPEQHSVHLSPKTSSEHEHDTGEHGNASKTNVSKNATSTNVTVPKFKSEPTVHGESMNMLIALGSVIVVVLLGIGFMMYRLQALEEKPGLEASYDESWGAEQW